MESEVLSFPTKETLFQIPAVKRRLADNNQTLPGTGREPNLKKFFLETKPGQGLPPSVKIELEGELKLLGIIPPAGKVGSKRQDRNS